MCGSSASTRLRPALGAQQKGAPSAPFSVAMVRASALGELERPARLGAAVLLALDHARVASEEAAALQHAAQVGLELGERLRYRVPHRAGLAGEPAARHRAVDVV